MTPPATIEEGRLEYDIGAVAHGGQGQRLGSSKLVRRAQTVLGDLDDPPALGAQGVEIGRLVQIALLLDQRDGGVVTSDRLLPQALDAPQFERREVVAGEIADEVRGADDVVPSEASCTGER